MQDTKPLKVPIPVGVKLSAEQCPKTQEEEEDMSRVPYAGAVSCMSKKQSVVALSTMEVEYMAATHARKEAVWLHRLCSSMGLV